MNELVLMVVLCECKNISHMKCADIEHTLSTAMAIQACSAPVEQKLLCVCGQIHERFLFVLKVGQWVILFF